MRMAVPDLISNSYFPAIAAVELGFAKEEGLDVDYELIFPVTKTLEALREGELDFVAGSAHSTLTAFADWQGAKLVGALAQGMYWILVLRADLNVARGDIDAVKGLSIGAAPGVDLGLRGLLTAAGIDIERDEVKIAPVPGATEQGVSFGVTAAKALEAGKIDGFWANAMGAEVAVQRGVGTAVLDVRRGDGPPDAWYYTFPALITSDAVIERDGDAVAAMLRAIVKTQQALREAPERATEVGERLFPPAEAALIATLIERDLPYYDAAISEEVVTRMNAFAQSINLLTKTPPFEQIVATQFRDLWSA